jgi:hypothetical protein
MTNNDIFKKLRVALQLRDDQIVDILQLVDFRISKAELGAFFRDPKHPKYMECGDQVLRNFLNGLVIHLRGTKEEPKVPMEVLAKNKAGLTERDPAKQTSKISGKDKDKLVIKKPAKNNNFGDKKKEPVVERVKFKNGKNKKS